jgi:hypothetical protein
VTGNIDSHASGVTTLKRRRDQLTIPAVIATTLGGLLFGYYVLVWGFAAWLLATDPGIPGEIRPSVPYAAAGYIERMVPVVVGVALIVFAWRYRWLGRTVATWVCAVTAIVVGGASFLF